MKYMGAAEFKAKCLRVMEEVAESGEEVVVTKRGEPVARILPPEPRPRAGAVGWGAGARFYVPSDADLTEPLVDPADWDYDATNLTRGEPGPGARSDGTP